MNNIVSAQTFLGDNGNRVHGNFLILITTFKSHLSSERVGFILILRSLFPQQSTHLFLSSDAPVFQFSTTDRGRKQKSQDLFASEDRELRSRPRTVSTF